MPPKGARRGPQPKQPPARSRPPRDRRSAPLPDSNLARKDACLAAFRSCRNGADRAEPAYNALASHHTAALEQEYQLHRADQNALRSALCKLCAKHQISYTQLHYDHSRQPPAAAPTGQSTIPAQQSGGAHPYVGLAQSDWDKPVVARPLYVTPRAYLQRQDWLAVGLDP